MATAARGTVRIFMAPKFDEKEKEWLFKEQRLLMIEMDRFTVNCNTRKSHTRQSGLDPVKTYFRFVFF